MVRHGAQNNSSSSSPSLCSDCSSGGMYSSRVTGKRGGCSSSSSGTSFSPSGFFCFFFFFFLSFEKAASSSQKFKAFSFVVGQFLLKQFSRPSAFFASSLYFRIESILLHQKNRHLTSPQRTLLRQSLYFPLSTFPEENLPGLLRLGWPSQLPRGGHDDDFVVQQLKIYEQPDRGSACLRSTSTLIYNQPDRRATSLDHKWSAHPNQRSIVYLVMIHAQRLRLNYGNKDQVRYNELVIHDVLLATEESFFCHAP